MIVLCAPPCLLLAVFDSYYSLQVDEEVSDNEVDTHMGEYEATSGLVPNDADRRLCICPCDGQGRLLGVMREHTQFYSNGFDRAYRGPTNGSNRMPPI